MKPHVTLLGAQMAVLLGTAFPGAAAGPDTAQAAVGPALDFVGCRTQFAAYPAAEAVLATMLPPGFEANPFSLLPTNDVGSVPLFIEHCESVSSGPGVLATDVEQAWLLIWVQPPVAWRNGSLTAYYWVVGAFVEDDTLAQVYSAWGVGPAAVARVDTERVIVAGNIWADRAHVAGETATLDMTNLNAGALTNWAGLRARFFGRAGDGSIHAADHLEAVGGKISGIQPSTVVGDGGSLPLAGAHEGLGRTFQWDSDQPSWSFVHVDLPPLEA